MTLRVFAPAKINLTLKVGRPRHDGMHPLQSVVAFADVGDWIEVSDATETELRVVGPFAAALADERDNIVLRAVAALARQVGVDRGASVTLEKNLPVASGIGGGSSDAAAALVALNDLWGLQLDRLRLAEMARTLGSDAPVCVASRSAFISGVGEAVMPLPLPVLHAVLVNPLRPLATAAVYRQFDAMQLGEAYEEARAPLWRTAPEAFAGIARLGNDLAAPARALLPEMAAIEAALRDDKRVRYAAMSGSGATWFALIENAAEAAAIAAELGERRPDWWVRAVLLGDS